MTSPPESEAAMAEPSEADAEFARKIATTISYTPNSQVRYHAALDIVAEIRAEARASAEGKWIAIGEQIAALKVELQRARFKRKQLDLSLSVRESDEPRRERKATPEEVAKWQAEADARVLEIEQKIEALRNGRDLPPLPPAPKASGR